MTNASNAVRETQAPSNVVELPVTAQPIPSTPKPKKFPSKMNMPRFKFEKAEQDFFGKHIWNVWSAEQNKLAERLRLVLADLSMNEALDVRYEVDFLECHQEIMTLSAGVDVDFMQATINDAHLVAGQYPGRLIGIEQLQPTVQAFELRNAGKKYGEEGDVDFETISYKLRQFLLDIRGIAQGQAQLGNAGLTLYITIPGPITDFKVLVRIMDAHAYAAV